MMSWGRWGEEMIKYGQEAKLQRFSSKVCAIHDWFLQSTLLFLKAGTNAAFSTCMNFSLLVIDDCDSGNPCLSMLALAAWSMYPELMLSEWDQCSSCSRAEQGNLLFPSHQVLWGTLTSRFFCTAFSCRQTLDVEKNELLQLTFI